MREAEPFSPGPSGLLNPLPPQRARLLLAQGELDAAARWAREAAWSRRRAPVPR